MTCPHDSHGSPCTQPLGHPGPHCTVDGWPWTDEEHWGSRVGAIRCEACKEVVVR